MVGSLDAMMEPATLLLRNSAELGARTLEIFSELVSRSNGVVSRNDLEPRVWPDITVEERSLRFHIVGLCKVLGDARESVAGDRVEEIAAAVRFPNANFPAGLVGALGRERGRRV